LAGFPGSTPQARCVQVRRNCNNQPASTLIAAMAATRTSDNPAKPLDPAAGNALCTLVGHNTMPLHLNASAPLAARNSAQSPACSATLGEHQPSLYPSRLP
jgi:hypothetical protein